MYDIDIQELRKRFTDTFHCKKLLEVDNVQELITTFKCERNPSMVNHIKDALDEDMEKRNKHYIVEDSNGNFVFYFSLRCGSMSECIDDTYIKLFDRMSEISQAFDNREYSKVQIIAKEIGINSDYIINNINSYMKKAKLYKKEMNTLTEKSVYRVLQSMPSVELVQFCANSDYKNEWKLFKFPIPLGASVFWFLITPIIKNIQDMIGCEYIHLFAADQSDELTLCSYYSNDLGFQFINDLATFKPFYDFDCIAMCLDAKDIDNLMKEKINYMLNDIDAALDEDIEDAE